MSSVAPHGPIHFVFFAVKLSFVFSYFAFSDTFVSTFKTLVEIAINFMA